MATVCLDNQCFYNPPVAGPGPADHRLLVRKGDPAPFLPPPPQQDAHDSRHSGAGKSQITAILIPDSESDNDIDDGRSDMSFPSLDELVAAASKKKSSGVASAGESDVLKPSATSGPEFADKQEHRGSLGAAPGTLSGSPQPSEKPFGTTSNHNGPMCLDNEEGDRQFPFSSAAIRQRRAPQFASGLGFESQQSDDHCLSQHYDRCGDGNQTGSQEHHHLIPDDREERARTPILPDDKSTTELEPADPKPRLRPQALCDATSRYGSCRLSQHDDSDPVTDERRHRLVTDREQDEDGAPAVQDRRAASNSTNEKTLATGASTVKPAEILLTPGNGATRREHMSFGHDVNQGSGTTRASSTELPNGEQVNLRQSTGRCRRRRYCDTDGKEDCFPNVGSDAKQGKDGEVIQPPQGKRRKVNRAPTRQARLRKNSLSLQAQQPPPTQGPKHCQGQRRIPKPQSSGASALEQEALEADFASFEEWPLEAVLKRVWVGGAATFQVEFTWNPCTDHGQHDRFPENPRRKSPGGRISSRARTLPSRIAPTSKKVLPRNEYYNVEKILKWRQGEKGLEYLVKWAGYGKKHNSWEPTAHFERCPEVLEAFHQKVGLSRTPSM